MLVGSPVKRGANAGTGAGVRLQTDGSIRADRFFLAPYGNGSGSNFHINAGSLKSHFCGLLLAASEVAGALASRSWSKGTADTGRSRRKSTLLLNP